MVISGGVDELYRTTYDGFASLMNSDKEPCKPFDANRNGLNLGEGSGIVILESERSLADRRKKPRAFLWGYGSASDAFHLTSPAPNGHGLGRAIQEALEVSGLAARDIGFINAHGTGTLDNDRIEARVLHDFFPQTHYFSTKGYTGHTLGAAGALEAAFTVACLESKKVPVSAGFTKPDPDLAAAPVSEQRKISARFALSETLAFGGINSVLVVGISDAGGN
jgi:3-oxoacyl-[acyl-carrier-protein] synthase-1/3-oxoacyl-[acyl-carrier-protein] synthase II